MLLLFKGVLCYVTQLSMEEVELQLLALPALMAPDRIRALLAATIWAAQETVQQYELCFSEEFAYRAKLPCGSMLAAAMGGANLNGVSRADAAGHSLTAQWIFSINPVAGTLRSRVESEGFLLVQRACAGALLCADACDDDDCHGGARCGAGNERHASKRRRKRDHDAACLQSPHIQ